MTATLPHTDTPSTDRVGSVENAGVEYLPEDARDSSPRNLGAVFLGANLTWTNVVFGAFAILFGLSFWQTLASMAVGTAVGIPWRYCQPPGLLLTGRSIVLM